MSFLAPLFLLGALAVALPVIFHLVRRTTRERTLFSSLMFLRPAPPRLTRRNRLENLLLLLLRCAALCLLAFGFARPFFKQTVNQPPPASEAHRRVVLVDTSASMRRGNLWAAARDRADAVLRKTTVADEVALFAFDRQLTPLVTFEQWNATAPGERVALARSQLANISPGWAGSHLDQALVRATELLTDIEEGQPEAGRRQVVVISDLQSGSHLDGLQSHEWPSGIEIVIEPLPAFTTSNAGLQLAAEASDVVPSKEATVRLRLSNEPDSKREQFEVGWAGEGAGFVGTPLTAYVPAGQNRILSLPVPAADVVADRVRLRGDNEEFDNTVFVIPPQPARATVIYFGKDSPADTREPRYFLERAFQETRRLAVEVVAPTAASPLTPAQAEAASLFIVTDALSAADAQQVNERVREGKTALLAPTTTAAASALSGLPELAPLAAEEGRFPNYGLLGEIDFRHPLFVPFADPRFSDFTKIHFWKHRRLNADAVTEARVPARFDNGDPALLEVPAGKGRVFVLASGWHPADSQLALSSKFVPLLYSLLDLSGASPAAPVAHVVGDPVPLDRPTATAADSSNVLTPDGKSLTLAAGENEFAGALAPGIYQVVSGAGTNRFAVNLDPAESRTTPLAIDDLERMGVPMVQAKPGVIASAAHQARLQSAELEGRQKLWRWLILATLAVVLFETWLAGWTLRRSATPLEATS